MTTIQTGITVEACIQACLDCYRHCQHTALTHCLEQGGKHTEPAHFRLMLDCAEVCRSTAALLLNESAFATELCALCAEICERCAQSCERLGDMQDCQHHCEYCAETCRQMAKAPPSPHHARRTGAAHPHAG